MYDGSLASVDISVAEPFTDSARKLPHHTSDDTEPVQANPGALRHYMLAKAMIEYSIAMKGGHRRGPFAPFNTAAQDGLNFNDFDSRRFKAPTGRRAATDADGRRASGDADKEQRASGDADKEQRTNGGADADEPRKDGGADAGGQRGAAGSDTTGAFSEAAGGNTGTGPEFDYDKLNGKVDPGDLNAVKHMGNAIGGGLAFAGVVGVAVALYDGDVRSGAYTGAEMLPIIGPLMALYEGRYAEAGVRVAEDAVGFVGFALGSWLPGPGNVAGYVAAEQLASEGIRAYLRSQGVEGIDPGLAELTPWVDFSPENIDASKDELKRQLEESRAAKESIIAQYDGDILAEVQEVQDNATQWFGEEADEILRDHAKALSDPRVFLKTYRHYLDRLEENENDTQAQDALKTLQEFAKEMEIGMAAQAVITALDEPSPKPSAARDRDNEQSAPDGPVGLAR